jgi:hypothetical protein
LDIVLASSGALEKVTPQYFIVRSVRDRLAAAAPRLKAFLDDGLADYDGEVPGQQRDRRCHIQHDEFHKPPPHP